MIRNRLKVGQSIVIFQCQLPQISKIMSMTNLFFFQSDITYLKLITKYLQSNQILQMDMIFSKCLTNLQVKLH